MLLLDGHKRLSNAIVFRGANGKPSRSESVQQSAATQCANVVGTSLEYIDTVKRFVKEQVGLVSVQTHCPIRIGSEITLREKKEALYS